MFSLFRNHKALFALTMALSTINSVLSILAAFILERILNAVVDGDWAEFSTMAWVVLVYIAVLIAMVSSSALAEKKLIVSAVRDLRENIQNGIFSRDNEQYKKTNTADYLSALTNDTKIIEDNVLIPFLNAIQYAIVFLMAAVALFVYSPIIGGVMLLCLVLMYALPASLGKPIGKRQEAYSAGFALFTLKLKDQLLGYEVIRSYRMADRAKADFAERNASLTVSKYGVDKLLALSEGIAQVIGAGAQIGTMLLSGVLVLNGQMAPGALLAILQLSGAFVQPVAVIMQSIPMIQGAKPVLDRLKEMCERKSSAFTGTGQPVFEKAITFEDVSFSYAEDRPVLNGMDAVIEKGRKYVIAGASGCGKSTLVRLLCAEYSGYSGAIRADGQELHELDIDKWLANIAVIHQGVYMFDESIKANISLHRDFGEDEWKRVLSVSGVDKFLMQTENGIDSEVGEAGSSLSGGQRQRIAVARALMGKKPILILDEGTSAVDMQTAYDIESALLGIEDLTMITITHHFRPELLRRYDAVLYMEHGRVAEAGRYDVLTEKDGGFATFQRIEREQE